MMDWSSLTSTEVPVMWLAGLIAAVVGWKTVKKTFAMAYGLGKKFGYGMLMASLMMISGLGGVGFGIGDLASRNDKPTLDSKLHLQDEHVIFDGVIAQIGENGLVSPIAFTEEQSVIWKYMEEEDKNLVWDILKEREKTATKQVVQHASYRPLKKGEWLEAYHEGYEIDPFVPQTQPRTVSGPAVDSPATPLQATWGIIFSSVGLVLVSVITGIRRLGGNKYDKPIN